MFSQSSALVVFVALLAHAFGEVEQCMRSVVGSGSPVRKSCEAVLALAVSSTVYQASVICAIIAFTAVRHSFIIADSIY